MDEDLGHAENVPLEDPNDLGEEPLSRSSDTYVAPLIKKSKAKLIIAVLTCAFLAIGVRFWFFYLEATEVSSPNNSDQLRFPKADSVVNRLRNLESEKKLVENAKEAWKNKDYQNARMYCDRLLELDPQNVQALVARCKINTRLRDWDIAVQDYLKLKMLDLESARIKTPEASKAFIEVSKKLLLSSKASIDNNKLDIAIEQAIQSEAHAREASYLTSEKAVANRQLTEVTDWLNRCTACKDAPANHPVELLKMRTWRDSEGKFSTRARFLSIANGKVKLERANGSRCFISTSSLSKQDQVLVSEMRKPK